MCDIMKRNCRNWHVWLRVLVVVLYMSILLLVLPFLIVRLQSLKTTRYYQACLIGGIFVLLTLPIAGWEILQHLIHYTKPDLQKPIIRILWMVPIYAVNAWIGLLFPNFAIYVDTCRECYEAYVIYNFLLFLLNYLKEAVDVETEFHDRPPATHFCPLCCLPPCTMGTSLIEKCKHGILQYTVIRPVTTVIAFICEMCGVYGEGEFVANVAYPYLAVANNLSQFVAMYCLVFFYKAHKAELEPMKPLPKFLCIKAVVFFSFFQGFLIAILVYSGVIKKTFTTDDGKVKSISNSLQDFLICIEMLIAAVMHTYAFSYKPYVNSSAENVSCWQSFKDMWDVSDVTQDVSHHIRTVGSSVGRSVGMRRATSYDTSTDERTRLLQPNQLDSRRSTSIPTSLRTTVLAGAEVEIENSLNCDAPPQEGVGLLVDM